MPYSIGASSAAKELLLRGLYRMAVLGLLLIALARSAVHIAGPPNSDLFITDNAVSVLIAGA